MPRFVACAPAFLPRAFLPQVKVELVKKSTFQLGYDGSALTQAQAQAIVEESACGSPVSAGCSATLTLRPQRRRALLAATFVAAVLPFLPEILLYAGSTALAPPTGGAVRLELKVEGMGCEACQLAVAGALQRASGVLDATVDAERAPSLCLALSVFI